MPSEAELEYLKSARSGDFIITKTGHILHVQEWCVGGKKLCAGHRSEKRHHEIEFQNLEILVLATNVTNIVRFKRGRAFSEQSKEYRDVNNAYFLDIPDKNIPEEVVVERLRKQLQPSMDRPPLRPLDEILKTGDFKKTT